MNVLSDLQQTDNLTSQVMKNQVIWDKECITIANKPLKQTFLFAKLLHRGVIYIQDLLCNHGDFLSHDEIKTNMSYGVIS